MSASTVAEKVSSYVSSLSDSPHCVRVICSPSTHTEEDILEGFISNENQPFPFVMAGMSFKELKEKTAMEIFQVYRLPNRL